MKFGTIRLVIKHERKICYVDRNDISSGKSRKEAAKFSCQNYNHLLTLKYDMYLAKTGNFHPILVLQGSLARLLRLPSPIPASAGAYVRRVEHKVAKNPKAAHLEKMERMRRVVPY